MGGGRRRWPATGVGCAALLVALLTGCAQAIPGTPHPEGEGPAPASGAPSADAGPPTDFRDPSGPPTVTVQPDETAPLVPGPLTSAPPSGTPAPPPTTGEQVPPQAAAPTGSGRPRATGGPPSTRDRSASPSPPGGGGAPGGGAPGGTPGSGTPASGPAAQTTLLTADVIDDECLLDAAAFAALLGGPVSAPAETAVVRPDGTSTRSCYALSRNGSPAPSAAVNVYRVNRGTPASFVRAATGGRQVAGVGEAAVLLDTVGGTTLQVATARYLVTVTVVDGSPSAGQWAAAGRAVVAAVGRG